MKNHTLLFLIVFLVSCKQLSINKNSSIDYRKMERALYFSFASSDIIDNDLVVYIYPRFENKALRNVTNVIYNSFDILGYDLNDSINEVIDYRVDADIPDSFFKTEYIKFKIVKDTIGFNNDFVVMSEPLFIKDSSLLFFTISCSLTDRYYGYYLEKNKDNGRYDLVYTYDRQKDILFEIKKP